MKTTHCHHCGNKIKWYRTTDGKGYWAHPHYIWNGRRMSEGNELVEQNCYPGTGRYVWATPKQVRRSVASDSPKLSVPSAA